MPTLDSELSTRITDVSDPRGRTSVRVLYVVHVRDEDERWFTIVPYGIFRLSDDSEIDFDTLSLDDRLHIEEECEQQYRKQVKQQNQS